MKWLRIIPAVVSAALLAAHFFRAGAYGLAGAAGLAPLLLIADRTATDRLLQLIMVAGFFVWADSLLMFYRTRVILGMPWTRMAIIMSGVALFTLVSARLLEDRIRNRIPEEGA